MDSSLQVSSNQVDQNAFEIYTIPKVSADGEPHEVMTMIAAISGLIAAIIVLIILIILIGCGNTDRHSEHQTQSNQQTSDYQNNSSRTSDTRITIIPPIFQNQKKLDDNTDLTSVVVSTTVSQNQCYENPVCDDNDDEHHQEQVMRDELILKAVKLSDIKKVQC